MKLGLYARDEYTQHSMNIFESDVSKLTGVDVPRFIHVLVVPGKYTAVLLVGAFVTSAALPWSCAGPGETCADGLSPVTLSTFEFSNCHARLGWGSAPEYIKLISNKL
jgi:hypothetical protein